MRFPLSDWIDAHADCRFDLARSGMRGVVAVPRPTARAVAQASEADLVARLAELVGVDRRRLFLTHGASEGNSEVVFFLARRHRSGRRRARVEYPEYPPLLDAATWAGFDVGTRSGPVDLAIASRPRNPVGDLWDRARMARFAAGARAVLVDETFRDFVPTPSLQRGFEGPLWTTGSFTKLYGADDLRVGFVVAPEPDRAAFARFHGVVGDEVAPYSVAAALAVLDRRERILAEVRRVFERNAGAWQRFAPDGPRLAAPLAFDRSVGPDGDAFARRCLRSSVLVCPGSFFGDPSGVRLCLTRRSFPRDFARYRAVRADAAGRRDRPSGAGGTSSDRRRRAVRARGAAARA